MNKKVLFIAYHFPPDAAVGALRTQKHVKYLPEHGWQPYVLTVKDKYHPVHDPRRMRDLSKAVVERTEFWRTPLQLMIDFRDNHIRKSCAQNNSQGNEDASQAGGEKNVQPLYLKRFLAGMNHLPDDKLLWLFPGVIKGLKLIRNHGIRILVVSTPPRSSIVLAYLLTILTRIKLVIDFRDPWTLTQKTSSSSLKPDSLLALEKGIEKKILKRTSKIITTNDFFRGALLKQHPFLSPGQVHVIQNGFDLCDFPSSNAVKSNEKYIISYLGTFYMQRNPRNFLRALSLFISDKGFDETDLEVRFIGQVEQAQGVSVKDLVKEADLEKVVRIVSQVPYSEALKNMRESDLLLLLAPDQPYQIPAKTYEYIAAKSPILALSEEGATASLIKESKCGLCVDPSDVEGIRQALHRFYDDYIKKGDSFCCDSSLFERRTQARQLVGILERL